MFLPPTMIEIIKTMYDNLDVAQKLPRNQKLGYKDHRTLTRHQQAYTDMTDVLFGYIVSTAKIELNNYLTNVQRFLCTLNAAIFETEASDKFVSQQYWSYVYAPMLACLLDHFKSEKYKGNTIHSIANLLIDWENHSDLSKRAKWVKDSIKKQYTYQTPEFTRCVNDIRGSNTQSREIINKNLKVFDEELAEKEPSLTAENRAEIVYQVSAIYHATMIIKRFEDKGLSEYLTYVKDYLVSLQTTKIDSNLLILHKKICSQLFKNPHTFFSWGDSELMRQVDSYILSDLQTTYPCFIAFFSKNDPCWPAPESFMEQYLLIDAVHFVPESPLEIALFNYYTMYYHIEMGDFEKAYEYCLKVEEASATVHLGEFKAANIIHKIILNWLIKGQMLHNQFDTEITTLIMTLPDELSLIAAVEPKFQQFYDSLSDNELMYLRCFAKFNTNHKSVQADPLKKLTEVINVAADICNNYQGEINDLVSILNRKVSSNILRSKPVLPFSKRLSLTDSLDMLPDLYSLVELKGSSTLELFYKLHKFSQCRDLIIEFDKT
ncbi:hypothetical protein [Acinetobacter variabilis]|uniref:hypothetical protein n=1 Tax=Acinetobacter variabilis TaxID=70346 RepID=UPI00289E7581|nr:hypothetical protein [Acinetobacter variabilis]